MSIMNNQVPVEEDMTPCHICKCTTYYGFNSMYGKRVPCCPTCFGFGGASRIRAKLTSDKGGKLKAHPLYDREFQSKDIKGVTQCLHVEN